MHPYIPPLQEAFARHANPERAASAKAYMRDQFDYYGLEAKLWRQLVKAHIQERPLPTPGQLASVAKQLWRLPQREFQYAAVEIVAACQKEWTADTVDLIEYCLVHKSWWDTVDHIASELTGPYFRRFPEQVGPVTSRWNLAANIWLQRSSIMFQKAYKKETDTALLEKYILRLLDSKEFFVQKAIGWALREYGKTNPDWVKRLVAQQPLSPLSKREALKRIG
jgi:3-methyladenine DNA glycosylase AlkD